MQRAAHSRLRLVTAGLLLISSLMALAPSGAVATNTRNLYFGSPAADLSKCPGPTSFCPLVLSDVSSPGSGVAHSAADLVIANLGGQALNHVVVLGGAPADSTPKNQNFAYPTSSSVPTPLSVFAVFPDPGASCAVSSSGFSCSVGQLRRGESVGFRVILNVPTGATTSNVWFMASLNEHSSNGKNQDSFFAVGSVGIAAATCGKNANYFVPSETVTLSTPASCSTQPTSIQGPNTTRGAFASVGTEPTTWCPPAFESCQGELSKANVNNGQSGPVVWTVKWNFVPIQIIHFRDGYDPITNPGAYDVIDMGPAGHCPASPGTMNCWFTKTTSYGVTTVVFQTATNGGARGV